MKQLIAKILTWQAQRFLRKFQPKVVAVAGSVGKTSTTQAVARVLSQSFKVTATIGSYNTDVGVPCSIFGRKLPGSLKNPFAWVWLLARNEAALLKSNDVEVLVLEVGTDVPGEIAQFAWLKPDIAVVTAIAHEHMEFFETLENVAKEELGVADYSKKVWLNKRMIEPRFLETLSHEQTALYDRKQLADFGLKPADLQVLGDHSIDAVVAALSVGKELGVDAESLKTGARQIAPRPGRMRELEGVNDTALIDDTYNASPAATIAALDYLYGRKAPQRIALLGNMNELGESSKQSHIEIGEYCNPSKLDLVVTLGPDANGHTARAARAHGCEVIETLTPYEAADAIKDRAKKEAVILLKGSQNKVFAEEATLKLLKNPADASKLVRQSAFWKAKKLQGFKEAS